MISDYYAAIVNSFTNYESVDSLPACQSPFVHYVKSRLVMIFAICVHSTAVISS